MPKIIVTLLFLCSSVAGFTQSFMQGAGLFMSGGFTPELSITIAGGASYSARFNFYENSRLSLSAGIPLSIGISSNPELSYDYNNATYTDAYKTGLVLDLPLLISVNLGRGSTRLNDKKMGYFLGAGFAYHRADYVSADNYDQLGNTIETSQTYNNTGPAVHAGLRFGVGKKHKNIEWRLSFFKGLNQPEPTILGMAALFNF